MSFSDLSSNKIKNPRTMVSKGSGRRRSSVKDKTSNGSIKNFFDKKEKPESIDKEESSDKVESLVTPDGSSPSKTSDYGSESSRSTTPTDATNSQVEKDGEESPHLIEEDENNKGADNTEESKMKREIDDGGNGEEEDDQGANLFGSSLNAEEVEDKAGVSAAVMSGLLSADVKDEEERIAAETARGAIS